MARVGSNWLALWANKHVCLASTFDIANYRSSQNIRPFVSKYTTLLSNFQSRHLPSFPSLSTRSKRVVGTSRRGSRDGFRGGMKARGPEMTRHDRRHKSVRGPSRRVWEATTTVFRGSTRGSRAHSSRYENGADRQCRIAPHSVIFVDKWTILVVKIQMTIVN